MFEIICWLFILSFVAFISSVDAEQNAKISPERIEMAQKLCAEREVEWISIRKVKCKDGSEYVKYYVEKD